MDKSLLSAYLLGKQSFLKFPGVVGVGLGNKVKVRVTGNQEMAIELLKGLSEIQEVKALDDHIAVTFYPDKPGDGIIAKTLVNGGIDIISLEPVRVKLDEAFLHLTKGIVH